MSLTITLSSRGLSSSTAEVRAVPVFDGLSLDSDSKGVVTIDANLRDFLAQTNFSGKRNEFAVLSSTKQAGGITALVGLGKKDKVTLTHLRDAAGSLARRFSKSAEIATSLSQVAAKDASSAEVVQALAEGFDLGAYQFDHYKSEAEKPKLRRVTLHGSATGAERNAVARAHVITQAVCFARDLVNEPAGATGPQDIAAAATQLLRKEPVRVQVLDERRIRLEGLGGVAGVGQGSERPPRFLKISYSPRNARGSLALVGKGVVFDSGGLSLKPADSMMDMKIDMSGAAAVIATMSALADLGVKVKVTAYVPLVENMPSGSAIRPGDVLEMRNGKTVEVLNTDAEGRLILADALALAVEDDNDGIVDLATLTGACVVALGEKVAGLMTNSDQLAKQVQAAADMAGEPVWPLPLPDQYKKLIEAEIADIKNVGPRWGGALTAGLFLQHFVDDVPWVHLDIAGPASSDADEGATARGGTGFGVRTLLELLDNYEPPARKHRPARKTPKTTRKTPKATRKSPARKKQKKNPKRSGSKSRTTRRR